MAPRARTIISCTVAVVVTAVGLVSVWNQIPSVDSIADLIGSADPGWLMTALAAETVAVLAFAMIQRRLVVDLGGAITRRASVELTLTSGAISMALPAGTAFGAGHTYRRLQRTGLRPADIGVTMVASAGILTGTLLALYVLLATPTLLDNLSDVIDRHTWVLVLAVVLLAVALLRSRRSRVRPRARREPSERPPPVTPLQRAGSVLRRQAADCSAAVGSFTAGSWGSTTGWAAARWSADFVTLIAATYAVGATIDLVVLAGIYLGIQALRQIPLTPGGIGVIEAALLAGLVTAGAAAAPAAAAVVIYRVLTFWLVLPAGGLAALLTKPVTDGRCDVGLPQPSFSPPAQQPHRCRPGSRS